MEASGFQKEIRSGILIQVQQVARADFRLTVGAVTQAVEVAASAALLSSDDPTVGQVIENKRIVDLPLNGRSYLTLTALAPGVSNTSSPINATSFQGGLRSAASITVNGQRNTSDHCTLDGIENTDPNSNSYIMLPSLDALEEFKVQSATYPAEYGFAPIQINVTTKSAPTVSTALASSSCGIPGSTPKITSMLRSRRSRSFAALSLGAQWAAQSSGTSFSSRQTMRACANPRP